MIYQENPNHDNESSKNCYANEGKTTETSSQRQDFSDSGSHHVCTRLGDVSRVDDALPVHKVKEASDASAAGDDDAGGADAVTKPPNIDKDASFNSVKNILGGIVCNADDLYQYTKVSSWQLQLLAHDANC